MASLTFRRTMTGKFGQAIHVTVYDEDGIALDPFTDPVDWSNLADTTAVEVASDGYAFTSTVVGADVVTATRGFATGSFTLTWTVRPLSFSSP